MNTFWLVIKGVLTGAVGPGISVMYATYGEVITERSGKINLGVEGAMLMGACFGFIAAAETGSEAIGVLSGALAGGSLSLLFAFMVINRRANQLATGLAITMLGAGITSWAGRSYVGVSIDGLDQISIPLLSRIPVIGEALFNQDILAYIAYALGPVLWFVLFRSRWGLSLRAVGESVEVAYAAGRNTAVVQYAAIAMGGGPSRHRGCAAFPGLYTVLVRRDDGRKGVHSCGAGDIRHVDATPSHGRSASVRRSHWPGVAAPDRRCAGIAVLSSDAALHYHPGRASYLDRPDPSSYA